MSSASAKPAWQVWTGRVLTALVALLMAFSAIMKLSRQPPVLEGFAKFGFPENALLPIGVVELACVVLYLVPRTAPIGAILVTGYLGGAIATHVRGGDPFIMPFLIGVVAWVGLGLRDDRIAPLLRAPSSEPKAAATASAASASS